MIEYPAPQHKKPFPAVPKPVVYEEITVYLKSGFLPQRMKYAVFIDDGWCIRLKNDEEEIMFNKHDVVMVERHGNSKS